CYNFPPHLRYLPENIYLVGVIAGPHKPDTHHINPYIQLLVNEFKPFWSPGVFFTRTRRCYSGRTMKALLVPLICDMLGARQVAGLPGTVNAHYFCTTCDLDIDDIEILDTREWIMRDAKHVRRIADLWKTASSTNDRATIFKAFGLRWTPLLELQYWDPVKFIVIDTMHALDINLLKHHIR
ncbi:hypothetical protein PLEOSDRAFT_1015212, partial [Pleurotus ostreatus PC15]